MYLVAVITATRAAQNVKYVIFLEKNCLFLTNFSYKKTAKKGG